MNPFSNNSLFIVFDGADNLGKTTQIELVYQYLLGKGKNVVITREPGGTPTGSRIRDIILNSPEKLPKEAETLLFLADRSIHINQKIIPLLEKNIIVLCDRFHLSTLVYQVALKGNDPHFIDYIYKNISNGIKPNISFIFHGKKLVNTFSDEFEKNLGNKSHEMLNKYYYEYGKSLDQHILVDANRTEKEVFEELVSYLNELIP